MSQRDDLQISLLEREKQVMLSDVRQVFDDAVHDTSKRGVVGPGTGAAFVEHEVVRALKKRMESVATELAMIELDKRQIFQIQKALARQYDDLLITMMSVPAAWGGVGSREQVNHRKAWEDRSKEILDKYFESEVRFAVNKRILSRRFDFKTTFLWILVGALVGNVDKAFDLISKIVDRFVK